MKNSAEMLYRTSEPFSYALIGTLLITILVTGLFPAFMAGMITYLLVIKFAPNLHRIGNIKNGFRNSESSGINQSTSRTISVIIIASTIITALTVTIWSTIGFFQSEEGSAQVLLQKLADIVDNTRDQCPEWLCNSVPASADDMRVQATKWLRSHANDVKSISESVGHTFIRILLGMIIGAMVSLHLKLEYLGPLAESLLKRVTVLSETFSKIVFAQIKISSVNTIATAIFILLILPAFDVDLPFAKTLIVMTFLFGLIPIAGNLISNTMMVIIALPFGLMTAIGCLAFLVALHKAEYFLNAKIIGTEIKATAWELLIAMVVMEAIFGIIGIVAAPILYAYVKQELMNKSLI